MKNKKIILFLLMAVSLFLITLILIINRENITSIFENTQKRAIEKGKIDATYRVVKIEGETINAVVTFDCDTPIEKIIRPDGVEITVESINKQKLAIDYNLVSGNQYAFKIKLLDNSEEKEYVLYADKDAKPSIKQDDSLLYPLITLYGVKLNKNVTIDYGKEENNYYSTDGGETWEKYEGQMTLQKECTIMARSFKDENEIVKVDTQEIKMNLADDALGAAAYDGSEDTYVYMRNTVYDAFDKCGKIKISSEMIGKQIRVKVDNDTGEGGNVYVRDSSGNILASYDKYKQSVYIITVPTSADYLTFYYNNTVHEVEVLNEPSFEVELHYPTITSEGIQKAYNVIKNISYFDTSEKKKYSLDDGKTWLDYNNEEIRLNIGDKIIAKGIDEYGGDSRTKTYTAVLPSDAIGEKAYDGDESTYYEENKSFAYSYVELDNSIIGKKVKVIQNQESFEIYICNENKEVINKIYKYGWGNSTTVVEIPEGAKYIGIFSSKRIYEFIPIN